MSDSREESPDWLRSFQPPAESVVDLPSGSESPLDHSPESDGEDNLNLSKLFKKEAVLVSDVNDNDDGRETISNKTVKGKSPNKVKRTPGRKRKNEDDNETGKRGKGKDTNTRNTPEKHGKSHVEHRSIWTLSSDSESSPDEKPAKKGKTIKKELCTSNDLGIEDKKEKDDILLDHDGESPTKETSTVKSPTKKLVKEDEKPLEKINVNNSTNGDSDIDTKDKLVKDNVSGKQSGAQESSSRMPLLLSEKVKCSKALVECEGESIDLSGDVGSVGRIVISDDSSKNPEMFLDLKGTIYKTTIVPSRTFCVVSFGQSEAKIEAIMNDYIQLKPQSNIYENETMVEGTLDGFSFDSDDEVDKTTVKADQHEAAEEQPDGKTKRKPDKTSGLTRKKGKPAGGKLPKKVNKKPQVSKRGKTKK
ncbi:hypothetical protein ACS0TY_000316 [Phlomoides rotata]